MSFIKSRLRRIEEHAGDRCPECVHKPQRTYPYYPSSGEDAPEVPQCPSCGRSLGVAFRVVYEGEGA